MDPADSIYSTDPMNSLCRSPIRKGDFQPLRRSPLRNSVSSEILEKASSEPMVESAKEFREQPRSRSHQSSPRRKLDVTLEIFTWEIKQRLNIFPNPYDGYHCWHCDRELVIGRKGKPLGLRCQCPGKMLFCSRFCRYTHWVFSNIKQCSGINHKNLNIELTEKDIKNFNKLNRRLKKIKSLDPIDF